MLYLDFSATFNTIIPKQLMHRHSHLGLKISLCNWVQDFLIGRPQTVLVGSNTSKTIKLWQSHQSHIKVCGQHNCRVPHHEANYSKQTNVKSNLLLKVEKTKDIVVNFIHSTPTDHKQCCCGESEQPQVPGGAHLCGPLLVQKHFITS